MVRGSRGNHLRGLVGQKFLKGALVDNEFSHERYTMFPALLSDAQQKIFEISGVVTLQPANSKFESPSG